MSCGRSLTRIVPYSEIQCGEMGLMDPYLDVECDADNQVVRIYRRATACRD